MKEKGQQPDYSELRSEEEEIAGTEGSFDKVFYKWKQKNGVIKGRY